ncbi:MAG: TlpA disulfide reductase family protein [Myxococcota bacterium]
MKHSKLALSLAVALTSSLPLACGSGDDASPFGRNAGSPVGKPAPTLAGKTIDGERVALSDLRGQVVLINVWATWCKPCNKELPELARLHDDLNPKGFSVLGVSVDKRQMLQQVHVRVRQHGLHYPMLFDPEGLALSDWKITGYPTSILIGRKGNILWRRNGMIHPNDPELTKQIESALAEAQT